MISTAISTSLPSGYNATTTKPSVITNTSNQSVSVTGGVLIIKYIGKTLS